MQKIFPVYAAPPRPPLPVFVRERASADIGVSVNTACMCCPGDYFS